MKYLLTLIVGLVVGYVGSGLFRTPQIPSEITVYQPPTPSGSVRPMTLKTTLVTTGDERYNVSQGDEFTPTWKIIMVTDRRITVYGQPVTVE